MSKKISSKLIIFIIIFFLFFLLLRWNSFTTPFERDEGSYAYSAWIMQKGLMPYEYSFLQKPPLIIYTYYLSQLISEDHLWPPRLLASIFLLGSSYFVYKTLRRKYDENTSWFAALIFIAIASSPILASLAANTEIFMLLPLTALVYLMQDKKYLKKLRNWIILGVLAALAILFKPICVYVVAFIFIYHTFFHIKKKRKTAQIVIGILLATLGGLITTFIVFAPFVWTNNFGNMFEQVITFNLYYVKEWGYDLNNLFSNLKIIGKSFWGLYILIVAFLIKRPKNWRFYAGGLLFSLIAVYQTNIRHYYLLLTPFLAIIAGVMIGSIAKEKVVKSRFGEFGGYVITGLVLLSILWPVKKQFGLTPEDLSVYIYGSGLRSNFYEAPLVSQKVKEITEMNECILVAGSEPEIYYYSKRLNCIRFELTYPLNINTPFRERYQKEVVNTLEVNIPSVIVVSKAWDTGIWAEGSPRIFIDWLEDKIKNDYNLVGGFYWTTMDKGSWVENLTDEELENTSLLIYKKK